MKIQFALERGTADVSKLIEHETRSIYSHEVTRFILDDGTEENYEAIESGFVCSKSLGEQHAGQVFDIFEYVTPPADAAIVVARGKAMSMVGEGYDFLDVAGFVARIDRQQEPDDKKLFCSEAGFLIAQSMGPSFTLLARVPAWKVSPEDINRSPLLKLIQTITA